ncbi:histidine phosphatase superfamily [Baffinella frigidus]|nr:histidine phosphatase superfamily [Cryptophyta sp. CCMP2293]|mmetsp:Transcript_58420/g.137932  ORF Transcript_58420/g.137932 Transcript_58420/m.137932 type:complete len:236 (-) Transcript_58420:94-801(-)
MQSVDNVRKELAGKEIYIIRHAQGEHNVSSKFSFDPPLTTEGLKQVKSQHKLATTLGVECVIVSPLRRTLQTADGLFPGHGNMIAFEHVREVMGETCNIRLPVAEAEKNFPGVDWRLMKGVGLEGPDREIARFVADDRDGDDLTKMECRDPESFPAMMQRSEEVIALLAARPETKIAVVSHCVFLAAFIAVLRGGFADENGDEMGDYLENCEIRIIQDVSPTSTFRRTKAKKDQN